MSDSRIQRVYVCIDSLTKEMIKDNRSDTELLLAYGRDGDEKAFEALAARHVNMIFAGAYAAKVYPYDPENARKWIQTLPQGPERTKALQAIYQNMPRESDAAKAFASENGLTE